MLALWGAGEAHEDDPENAIRAVLDIRSRMHELGEDLPTRASLDRLEEVELLIPARSVLAGATAARVHGATFPLGTNTTRRRSLNPTHSPHRRQNITRDNLLDGFLLLHPIVASRESNHHIQTREYVDPLSSPAGGKVCIHRL